MVKAVVGEETRLSSTEDRLSRSAILAQVGLVVGQLSSGLDRGFVFDLIPTPKNEAGDAACSVIGIKDDKKKLSKSKSQSSDSSSLSIDSDWVAEHARQVSRLLLGGMKVIGLYVWASDSAYKNSTTTLLQTMKALAEASQSLNSDLDEKLLIHICYSPSRWSCRTCVPNSSITSSSLRPCDFKIGKVLSSLQKFRCTYNFDLRVPIKDEGITNAQTFRDILHQEILVLEKDLRTATATVDRKLVVGDEPCTTDGVHQVALYLPLLRDPSLDVTSALRASGEDVSGLLVFSGSVCSYTYLNSKEPISQAVSWIKDDIIRSLHSRLDIIYDDADEYQGYPPEDGDKRAIFQPIHRLSRNTCYLLFPRRVFIPWLAGTFICDYLQPSESLQDLKDHCVELMCMEALPDASTILEVEVEGPSSVMRSFWTMVIPYPYKYTSSADKNTNAAAETPQCSGRSKNSYIFNVLAPLLVLLLSIILGLVLYAR